MCIKYVTYIFSTAIGRHICGLWHITKPKKNEKIIQCPPIKYFPFFKVIFFPKKEFIMHLLLKKCKKTHFLNGFSAKNCKLLNGLKFSWCTSISITTKKNHYKIPPITLVLNYIFNFSYFVTCIFSTQIYFICSSLQTFVGFSF